MPSSSLSIVETALAEILERLSGHESRPETRALADRAFELETELAAWHASPPTDARRRELVTEVIDLAVRVMHLR